MGFPIEFSHSFALHIVQDRKPSTEMLTTEISLQKNEDQGNVFNYKFPYGKEKELG